MGAHAVLGQAQQEAAAVLRVADLVDQSPPAEPADDPVDRLAVSVLTNAVDGPALALASGIVRLVDLAAAGDSDATVPFEGSGKRTHEAVAGSELVVVDDAPHGFNVSHADEFNQALLSFLQR